MKQYITPGIALIVFVLLMFVTLVSLVNARGTELLEYQSIIKIMIPTAGSIIAILSGLALLFHALEGQRTMAQLFRFILPLLAGVMIMEYHWMTPFAIALLGIAMTVKHIFHPDMSPSKQKSESVA